jgi:hypothetical protein
LQAESSGYACFLAGAKPLCGLIWGQDPAIWKLAGLMIQSRSYSSPMGKFFTLLTVFILISNPGIAQSQMKTWQPEELAAFIALSNRSADEQFLVEGYVMVVVDCACPENAQCKPCQPHFILSKDYRKLAYGENFTSGLSVAYHNDIKIEQGEKHSFLVKVPAKYNDVELEEIVK